MICQATAQDLVGSAGTGDSAKRTPAELALAASVSAPARARRHLGLVLDGWGLGVLAETAGLLVSELVTNAVRASGAAPVPGGPPGEGGQIGLTVRRSRTSLVIEVRDPSPREPVRGDAGVWEEDGRGLVLVESLSSDWGFYPDRDGKIVWCEIVLPGGRSAVGGHAAAPTPARAGWEHGDNPHPAGGARTS